MVSRAYKKKKTIIASSSSSSVRLKGNNDRKKEFRRLKFFARHTPYNLRSRRESAAVSIVFFSLLFSLFPRAKSVRRTGRHRRSHSTSCHRRRRQSRRFTRRARPYYICAFSSHSLAYYYHTMLLRYIARRRLCGVTLSLLGDYTYGR